MVEAEDNNEDAQRGYKVFEGWFIFSNFSSMFLNLKSFFSNLNSNFSNLLNLRNQEQVKKKFCYQKLF